jgi:hypothetical protein
MAAEAFEFTMQVIFDEEARVGTLDTLDHVKYQITYRHGKVTTTTRFISASWITQDVWDSMLDGTRKLEIYTQTDPNRILYMWAQGQTVHVYKDSVAAYDNVEIDQAFPVEFFRLAFAGEPWHSEMSRLQ